MVAFVLKYSTKPARYPTALRQLAAAIQMVRQHAQEWLIIPDQILVGGFSAGAHLAASLGTKYDDNVLTKCGFDPLTSRPDGLLLGYPVITSGRDAHRDSFIYLLGPDATATQLAEQSLERLVSASTPPAFIWSTAADETIPVNNALLFAEALNTHHVSFALHIFPQGHHGLGLATPETSPQVEPAVAAWAELFATWVKGLGLNHK